MKHLVLLFISISLISCSKTEKKEQPFDSFVYSLTTLHLDYMVKLTNSDTVYFWKRFPKPETINYAIMSESQRNRITALVKNIDFTKYKSDYTDENMADGVGLRFDVTKNGKMKSINIYGSTAPSVLYTYASQLNEFIKDLNFQPYNGKINFGKSIRPDMSEIFTPDSVSK